MGGDGRFLFLGFHFCSKNTLSKQLSRGLLFPSPLAQCKYAYIIIIMCLYVVIMLIVGDVVRHVYLGSDEYEAECSGCTWHMFRCSPLCNRLSLEVFIDFIKGIVDLDFWQGQCMRFVNQRHYLK